MLRFSFLGALVGAFLLPCLIAGAEGGSPERIAKLEKDIEELSEDLEKLSEELEDEKDKEGFISLLSEDINFGGEIELEFVDSQREHNPASDVPSTDESSPYLRIDKLRLSTEVGFTGSDDVIQVELQGDIDFQSTSGGSTAVDEFYLSLQNEHCDWAESELKIGLEDPFMRPDRNTEFWPLAATAFWRREKLGFFWNTTLSDRDDMPGEWQVYLSLSNGTRLEDVEPGEDDAFHMVGYDARIGGSESALREYGFGVYWEKRWWENDDWDILDHFDTEFLGFYYNDSLGADDDSAAYLNTTTTKFGPDIGNSALQGRERYGGNARLDFGGNLWFTVHAMEGRDGRLKRRAGFFELGYEHEFEDPLLFDDLLHGVRPLIRYGWLEVDTPPLPGQPATWDRRRWTFGVMTELRRTMFLRTEYAVNDEDTGDGDPDTNELVVQLELVF